MGRLFWNILSNPGGSSIITGSLHKGGRMSEMREVAILLALRTEEGDTRFGVWVFSQWEKASKQIPPETQGTILARCK